MAKKMNKQKKAERTWHDFRAIDSLPYRLLKYVLYWLHVSEAEWKLAVAKIRQGEAYREKKLSKGPGKAPRVIHIPCAELKRLQQAVKNRFLDTIPVHPARYGGQRGDSRMTMASVFAGHSQHVFETDLVQAYPSVFRSRVRANLAKPLAFQCNNHFGREFSEEDLKMILEVICDIVCFHDCLPQGSPCSGRLLDIVCYKMDRELFAYFDALCGEADVPHFTVWVDNLCFGGALPIPEEHRAQALVIIRENGFIPHADPEKTVYFSPENGTVPTVTGLVLLPDGRIAMHKRKRRQMRAAMHHFLQMEEWDESELGKIAGIIGCINQVYPSGRLPSDLKDMVPAVVMRRTQHLERMRLDKKRLISTLPLTVGCRIFCDGASSGNNGKRTASIGVVLKSGSENVQSVSRMIGDQTNNQAEYEALIEGLHRASLLRWTDVDCFLDSELVVKQVNGEIKTNSRHLRLLRAQVLALIAEIGSVRVHHIPREHNAEADALAQFELKLAHAKAGRTTPYWPRKKKDPPPESE